MFVINLITFPKLSLLLISFLILTCLFNFFHLVLYNFFVFFISINLYAIIQLIKS